MRNLIGRVTHRWFAPLLGLSLALPAFAGTTAGSDPIATARDWTAAVQDLMAGPTSGQTRSERHNALLNRAWNDGTVPVIVRVKETLSGAAASDVEVQSTRAAKRQAVLGELGLRAGQDRAGRPVKSFTHMGDFALRADAIDVLDLLDNPEVLDVVEDVAYPPALLQSVPLIGATSGAFAGFTGQGQVVAILDTGVDKTHAFLTGKVVSEACYSTSYPSSGISSLCPGGATASTATGSGVNCNASTWGSGCSHGTHVAGIAAGKGSSYSGVAKDAQVIAIQVFSGFPSASCGGSPCVMAYTSDIIKGLERVYALRTSYSVAAVNLSLGGGGYTSPCDSDPTKTSIDKLRTAGIATVIASGNDSSTNTISAPGCISTAVSVGATCDASGSYCSAADAVATYSNSASFLSLLAPGSAINSSVPGGGYASWHGTSMATPHVVGAWAVIKQAKPAASVDEILSALKTTGKLVTDSRNAVKTPRIQPAAAIALLQKSVALPQAPLIAAATNVTLSGFTANWGSVTGATGYRLDVSTSSSFGSYVTSYQNLDLGAATSRPVSGLSAGTTYYYRVRAYNAGGVGSNSGVQSATTLVAAPATPKLNAATNVTLSGFTANWGSAAGATGYRLDVSTSSSFSSYVTGYQNLTLGATASYTVSGLSAGTTYYYRLRAVNASGVSSNSSVQSVTTLAAPPIAPALIAATKITKTGFQLNWTAAARASGYRLDVATDSNFATLISGYNNLDLGNNTGKLLTGLKSNTRYYVRLRAYSTAGTSGNSGTLAVTTAR